jgi:hypothetical protein
MTTTNHELQPETASILQHMTDAQPEPPADLWQRIEAAHGRRVRRRRRQRFTAGGAFAVALVAAFLWRDELPISVAPQHGTEVDWQARAQALELQLLAIERENGGPAATAAAFDADPATSELAEIDRRLQAAYERKTYTNQLAPLWKRRSELLDALIAARKEGLTLTRI